MRILDLFCGAGGAAAGYHPYTRFIGEQFAVQFAPVP